MNKWKDPEYRYSVGAKMFKRSLVALAILYTIKGIMEVVQ